MKYASLKLIDCIIDIENVRNPKSNFLVRDDNESFNVNDSESKIKRCNNRNFRHAQSSDVSFTALKKISKTIEIGTV